MLWSSIWSSIDTCKCDAFVGFKMVTLAWANSGPCVVTGFGSSNHWGVQADPQRACVCMDYINILEKMNELFLCEQTADWKRCSVTDSRHEFIEELCHHKTNLTIDRLQNTAEVTNCCDSVTRFSVCGCIQPSMYVHWWERRFKGNNGHYWPIPFISG